MRLQLLAKEQCPFCLQVKIALRYFEIDYDLQETKAPDKAMLLQYSPQGSAPILLVDDFPIWDSLSIIDYLEAIADSRKTLFPGNEIERAQARLLQIYSNTIVGKDLREVIFEKRDKPESAWDLDRIDKGTRGWRKTLDALALKIESSQSFLRPGFSVADAALLPRFELARRYGAGVDATHPQLLDWFQGLKTQNFIATVLHW